MNATELADELENTYPFVGVMEIAATMLRQQQQLIDILNGRIERMIENASHHEGIAHAGGFEAGWQAAQRTPLTNEQIEKLYFNIFEPTPGIGLNLTNGQYELDRKSSCRERVSSPV